MKESILFFDERVLNNGIDTSEFQDVFTALQQGEYQRVDLKPLKGKKGYFRAKTNKKATTGMAFRYSR